MYHGVSLIYCDLTEIRHFVFGMPENKYREEYSEYRSGNEIFVVHSFQFFLSLHFPLTEQENEIPMNMMFMTAHPITKNQNAAKKQFE